jgi:two-component SAPR family response regulator/Tfp pilus assembly protein PilF
LNRAEAAQRENNDRLGLARTLARRATANRIRGFYQDSIRDGEEVINLSKGIVDLQGVQAEASRAIGISYQYQGKLENAHEMLEKALFLYQAGRDFQNIAMLQMELGICSQYEGNTRLAVQYYERSLTFWQSVRNTARQSFVLNNLGSLFHLEGEYIEAAKLFEQALTLARGNGVLRSEAYLLFNLGNLYADLEANDSARDALQKTRDACQTLNDHFLLLNADLAEATLARREEKFTQANAYLRSAKELVDKSHSGFEQSLWSLEAGSLYLAEGKLEQSIDYLTSAQKLFIEGGQRLEGASAGLLLCRAYTLKKDPKSAKSSLKSSLELIKNLDSIQPLIVAGRITKEDLKKYFDDDTIGPTAVKLLNRIENFERQIPALRRKLRPHASTVLLVPPKLSIYALGRAQVKLDGKTVTVASWANQKRARELFFFLICHANKSFTKEEIGVNLWPESSTEQLRLQFRNTVYYIRIALGQDVIVNNERRYSFNSDIDYSYDVQEFESIIQQSDSTKNPADQVELLMQGLEIYQGEFFPEGEGIWVMTERQRLAELQEHSRLTLAQLLLEKGEPKSALRHCQIILSENHCMESAHRLAMQSYAALGNRSGINSQYEQCQHFLMDELGIEPSTETVKLFKLLL